MSDLVSINERTTDAVYEAVRAAYEQGYREGVRVALAVALDSIPVSQLAHAAIVRGGFEPEFGTYDVQRPGPLYRLVEEATDDRS